MFNGGVTTRRDREDGSFGFEGRSFVVACDLERQELRSIEREIEGLGGSVHPFLNAVTDILVVGPIHGNDGDAHWAREQIRRGKIYRDRWGHLEFVSETCLRAALEEARRKKA